MNFNRMRATVDEIRKCFDDVERFSNLRAGQSATVMHHQYLTYNLKISVDLIDFLELIKSGINNKT